ncbi:UNKNOWN [Stylonychia lemnae]|uniref:Uncharacterized protein n=1 Tax=Stylonychia lemnae TaxID=5949 RepID=A0A078AZA5_STYLE|nr:UNKNOWN [Stylonychia lemnae]|eukprot:CDW87436.1 UNKNOWN [Stylonychia lemnae]
MQKSKEQPKSPTKSKPKSAQLSFEVVKHIYDYLKEQSGLAKYDDIVKELEFKYPDIDFTLQDLLKNEIMQDIFTKLIFSHQVQNKVDEDQSVWVIRNRTSEAYKQIYQRKSIDKKQTVKLLEQKSTDIEQQVLDKIAQMKQKIESRNDYDDDKTQDTNSNDQTARSDEKLDEFNSNESKIGAQKEESEDKQKLEIVKQIIKMEQEQEALKHKLNNDQQYINLLHEYNYLKDACFQLVEIVANIAQVPAKDIFEQYDVRDVELDQKQK